ncbi:exported hypothetical protein [Pseudomonas chlororaphis]
MTQKRGHKKSACIRVLALLRLSWFGPPSPFADIAATGRRIAGGEERRNGIATTFCDYERRAGQPWKNALAEGTWVPVAAAEPARLR